MKSINVNNFPEIIEPAIALGRRIATARKRRKIRQADMATKTGLSRSTIQAIERGDLTCSTGALLNVLWTMGLIKELDLLADPGLDRDGLTLALNVESKRVGVSRKVDNDF
ncbi:MAG: hypothetical protein CTY38_01120 [Methylotenera sp.]|uniref:helix-turn-helix domain-containing protein n=1 Tax=Methylotenera sp. TaxID=2051956 RepID=UPI000D4C2147|nr:helix-turn-helix transcriptional regulator [Methylotenera sp.]PPC84678.1 MAG: hypothetical protein CTY38_01120 [Methylotenera sp.]